MTPNELDPANDPLWNPASSEPDPFLSGLESSLSTLRPPPAPPSLARIHARKLGAAGMGLLAAGLALAFLLSPPRDPVPSWMVRTASGDSPWKLGDWLDVGGSAARADVPRLGRLEFSPGSRVRLIASAPDEQRIELERGSLDAFIVAPPRLFFVETPGATAIDMGCAYILDVDERGDALLRVSLGWVELVRDDRIARVPSGSLCAVDRVRGPGLPRFADASHEFADAILDYERNQPGALDSLLAIARTRDALTLWHVLREAQPGERERIIERIVELSPDGEGSGLDREGLARLDHAAMERLWAFVRARW